MPEDHGWHVHLLVLVHLDGNPLAVVVDLDLVLLGVDVNLDSVHLGVALLVVGRIDQYLVEDLVEAGNEGDLAVDDLARLGVVDPHLLRGRHDRADVGVGPKSNNLNFPPSHSI